MGLLQTDDSVLADMGVIVVHVLLLAIHRWNHGKAVPGPARKQRLVLRNLGGVFFQLAGSQLNVTQLLADCLAAFRLSPFLAFCQLQVRLFCLFRCDVAKWLNNGKRCGRE